MKYFFVAMVALCFASAASAETPQQCDMNNDGVKSSMQDYVTFFDAFSGRSTNEVGIRAADLDHNGEVTVFDYGILLRECPIDYDAAFHSAEITKINPARS